MAVSSQGLNKAIQFILAIVIAGLGYVLYLSITEPYEAVERRKEVTRQTRERMSDVRTALIMYQRENDRYPLTLDSLVAYVQTDSLIGVAADSIFGVGFLADSLVYSPRTGRIFEYAVNDTSRVKIYLLKDPDSEDVVGSLQPDITLLNASSWE
jgi:type II secretory pathway pseudopilin PulG